METQIVVLLAFCVFLKLGATEKCSDDIFVSLHGVNSPVAGNSSLPYYTLTYALNQTVAKCDQATIFIGSGTYGTYPLPYFADVKIVASGPTATFIIMDNWSGIGHYSWDGVTFVQPGGISYSNISFNNCTLTKQKSPIKLSFVNADISNCQFINNTGSGALYGLNSTLQIQNSLFEGNSFNETDSTSCKGVGPYSAILCGGGAVLALYSDISIFGSRFYNNFAQTINPSGFNGVAGGALQLGLLKRAYIDQSIFEGNYVSVPSKRTPSGDSIYILASESVIITNTIFSGFDPLLTALLANGNIDIEGYGLKPNVTLSNVTFTNLRSLVAYFNFLNVVEMDNITVANSSVDTNRTITNSDGAIAFGNCQVAVIRNLNLYDNTNIMIGSRASKLRILDSVFYPNIVPNNKIYSHTGLITTYGYPITSINSKFVQNTGLCLYLQGTTPYNVSVSNCSFENNGAAILGEFNSYPYLPYPINMAISNSHFQTHTGGAVQLISDKSTSLTLHIENCSFYNNSGVDGGALYIGSINSTITNCTFINNRVSGYGGSIYITANLPIQTPPIFSSNNVSFSLYGNYFSDSYAQVGGSIYSSLVNPVAARVDIKNSDFLFSQATLGGVMAFSSAIYYNSTIEIENCTMANSNAQYGGILYATDFIEIGVSTSTFKNSSGQQGGAIYVDSTILIVEDSLISGCTTIFDGGAAFITSNDASGYNNFTFSNVTFEDSSSTLGAGGALSISTQSSTPVLVSNCHFENNSALSFGGAIYSTANSQPSFIDSKFIYNNADEGGAIYLDIQSRPNFQHVNFTSNSASSGGGAVAIYGDAIPQFVNVTFLANTGANGGAVLVTTFSSASFDVCFFIDNVANSGNGGAVYATTAVSASPIFTKCTFDSNSAQSGGAFAASASQAHFTECTMTRNVAKLNGGAVFITETSGPQFLEVEFSENLALAHGGGLHCEGTSNFTANNVQFISNNAVQGGGVNAQDNCIPNISLSLLDNNNASISGGAIFVHSSVFFIMANDFTGNSAANGAGVYMGSGMGASAVLANNSFQNGTASNAGGALFWDLSIQEIQNTDTLDAASKYAPKCTSCDDLGNHASYGNFVATNPTKILFDAVPESLELKNGAIGPFHIRAVDFYQQTILGSTPFPVVIEIVSNTADDTPALLGVTESTLINGTAIIPQLLVGGSFNHEYTLVFSLVGPLLGNISTLNISISYAGCSVGQGGVATHYDTCKDCSAGTYNLNGNGSCLTCPSNAICGGKDEVVANENFYLYVQNFTVDTYSCPEGYCQKGGCGAHRSGLLCGTCAHGYQNSYGSCIECSKNYDPSSVFGDIVLLWLYVIVLQFSSKLPNQKFDDGRYVVSGIVKIILFYLQTVGLVFNHEQSLQRLFGFFNFQFFVPFSHQCSVKMDFFGSFLLAVMMPLILLGILVLNLALQFILWLISRKCSSKIAENTKVHFTTYIRTLWSIVIFSYSHITLAVFSVVICRNVGTNRVVAASPDVSCSTTTYKHWSTFAYFIFVYIALVPIIVAYLVRYHRKKKVTNVFAENIGVLFQSFKDDKYYWEAVILIRRLLFIMIYAVAFSEPGAKNLALFLFAILVLVHHLLMSPYCAKIENLLETALLMILAILAGIQNAEASGVYPHQMKVFSTVLAYLSIIPIGFGVHCIVQDVLFRHAVIQKKYFVPDNNDYEAVRVRSDPDLSSARSFEVDVAL